MGVCLEFFKFEMKTYQSVRDRREDLKSLKKNLKQNSQQMALKVKEEKKEL
jgi:hypothetical protein